MIRRIATTIFLIMLMATVMPVPDLATDNRQKSGAVGSGIIAINTTEQVNEK